MPEAQTPYSFDALISYPLAKWICTICHFSFLTANIITLARLVPASIYYWTYLTNDYYWSFISIIITVFMGCLDGTYARMYNQCSPFGKLLNNRITTFIHTLGLILVMYKKENYSILVFLLLDVLKRYSKKRLPFHKEFKKYVNRHFFIDNGLLILIVLYPWFIF